MIVQCSDVIHEYPLRAVCTENCTPHSFWRVWRVYYVLYAEILR